MQPQQSIPGLIVQRCITRHYSGISDPKCIGAAAGCLLGSFIGYPIQCCCAGCLVGMAYKHAMTSIQMEERVITQSPPIRSQFINRF